MSVSLAGDPAPGILHAPLNLGSVAFVGWNTDELLGNLVLETIEQPLIAGQLLVVGLRRVVLLLGR